MHPVCRLAQGELHTWRGLEPFPAAKPPACLQSTGEQGWLRFHREPLAYRVYRLAQSQAQVWLFSPGEGDVCLVEVSEPQQTQDMDQLGLPDLRYHYPIEARLQRPLGNPLKDQEEYVYASHGISLLFNVPARGEQRLARVRGFRPMSAAIYRDRFVELPPVRWFPSAK